MFLLFLGHVLKDVEFFDLIEEKRYTSVIERSFARLDPDSTDCTVFILSLISILTSNNSISSYNFGLGSFDS